MSVGIRVNPDVTTETHPYISTGKSGIKFGVPIDQVPAAAALIAAHPFLELTTLAMHLGSQLVTTEPFRQGIARLLELAERLRAAGTTTLKVLDVGGGLGIRYGDEHRWIPSGSRRRSSHARADRLHRYLEPGRFLVGSAGVLLTEVLYRKHSGGKEFVVVDAGMNDLVRPSHYQAYHEIVEMEEQGRPPIQVDVVGPVCETGDFLALDRSLPEVRAGRAAGGARRGRVRLRDGVQLQFAPQTGGGRRRRRLVVGGAATRNRRRAVSRRAPANH